MLRKGRMPVSNIPRRTTGCTRTLRVCQFRCCTERCSVYLAAETSQHTDGRACRQMKAPIHLLNKHVAGHRLCCRLPVKTLHFLADGIC